LFVPEAWGRDAFVTLGALARVTERIGLGTGIVNVYSRTPALLAMAALTLDEISGGRATLGLGTSGQRVVEGWHGVPMARPLRGVGRERASFTVAPFLPVIVSDDDAAARAVLRRHLAFYIGGMGRFYRETVARHGFGDRAAEILRLWEARQRDAAADAVTDKL